MLLANFQQIILLSVYQFNKQYFTENFCENIDVPEKNCYGKCYINKNIAQQQEEKNGKDFSFKWKEVEIYCNKIEVTIIKIATYNTNTKSFLSYASKLFLGITHKLIQPPQA